MNLAGPVSSPVSHVFALAPSSQSPPRTVKWYWYWKQGHSTHSGQAYWTKHNNILDVGNRGLLWSSAVPLSPQWEWPPPPLLDSGSPALCWRLRVPGVEPLSGRLASTPRHSWQHPYLVRHTAQSQHTRTLRGTCISHFVIFGRCCSLTRPFSASLSDREWHRPHFSLH